MYLARRQRETELQLDILKYLKARGIFSWPDKQIEKRTAHWTVNWSRGVPDILGIYRKRPLAFEVKVDKGKPSKKQQEFLHDFEMFGGLCGVIRSVEDAIGKLKEFDERIGKENAA